MARRPNVRYFNSRGGYFCQWQGKQYKLALGSDDAPTGPVYNAALDAFRRLMKGETTNPGRDEKTVASLWDDYRHFLSSRRSATTLAIRSQGIVPFVERHGTLPCRAVNHGILYAFMDSMRQQRRKTTDGCPVCWGDGSVRISTISISAMFGWAVKAGLLAKNPTIGLEKPAGRSRGEESIITDEMHRTLLAHTRGTFRELLICLEGTGARPGELIGATAANFDAEEGCIVYRADALVGKKHKTARTGKDRRIYLTGEALKIITERAKRYRKGPLFGCIDRQTAQYKGYTPTGLTNYFRDLRERCGLEGITAYSYRHTFATKWLLNDRSVEKLAELLGNSPKIILQHYSHLGRFRTNLRDDLERFRCQTAGEPIELADGVCIGPAPVE